MPVLCNTLVLKGSPCKLEEWLSKFHETNNDNDDTDVYVRLLFESDCFPLNLFHLLNDLGLRQVGQDVNFFRGESLWVL